MSTQREGHNTGGHANTITSNMQTCSCRIESNLQLMWILGRDTANRKPTPPDSIRIIFCLLRLSRTIWPQCIFWRMSSVCYLVKSRATSDNNVFPKRGEKKNLSHTPAWLFRLNCTRRALGVNTRWWFLHLTVLCQHNLLPMDPPRARSIRSPSWTRPRSCSRRRCVAKGITQGASKQGSISILCPVVNRNVSSRSLAALWSHKPIFAHTPLSVGVHWHVKRPETGQGWGMYSNTSLPPKNKTTEFSKQLNLKAS